MVTKMLAGLVRSAQERFATRFGRRRSASKRSLASSGRTLRMESLEGRELMAVAIVDRSWKEFEFHGPLTVSGNLSGKYGVQPVSGKFNGNLNITGEMQYTSVQDAAGQGTAVGTVSSMIYGYGNLPTLNMNGTTDPGALKEVAGKFSAVLPPDGPMGAVTLGGTLNVKDLTVTGSINFTLMDTVKGVGTWKGTLIPDNPQPLTVTTSAAWDPVKPGVVDVHVEAGGSVQKATNRNTAVANVTVFWGNAAGAKLTKLPDTIPVLWNQASGNYELSKLPVPPVQAAKLVFVTTYGKTVNTTTLDLPARPGISISNVSITPPATGFGDAVFNISISGDTAFPVTVKYTTVNGTAVKGQDFTNVTGTLTFVPGGPTTQSIVVKVKKDTTVANQDFYVQLSAPTWGTITGTGKGTGSIIDVP